MKLFAKCLWIDDDDYSIFYVVLEMIKNINEKYSVIIIWRNIVKTNEQMHIRKLISTINSDSNVWTAEAGWRKKVFGPVAFCGPMDGGARQMERHSEGNRITFYWHMHFAAEGLTSSDSAKKVSMG